MQKTPIDYLTDTWNPIAMRCTPCSDGCANCWHIRMCKRMAKNPMIPKDQREIYAGDAPPKLIPERLHIPKGSGKVIGVEFMGDLFHDDVEDSLIDSVFAEMALCQSMQFVVLTKRDKRMERYFSAKGRVRDVCLAVAQNVSDFYGSTENVRLWSRRYDEMRKRGANRLTAWTHDGGAANSMFKKNEPEREYPSWVTWPLPNVLIGVTVESNKYRHRAETLLKIPAAVRFVSHEPALGPLDFWEYCADDGADQDTTMYEHWKNGNGIDLVITGGTSGPGAPPMHPDIPRHDRDQCAAAGVPFFFKQWGEWIHDSQVADCVAEIEPDWLNHCHSKPCPIDHENQRIYSVGKKVAGHLLDGKEHREWPKGAM